MSNLFWNHRSTSIISALDNMTDAVNNAVPSAAPSERTDTRATDERVDQLLLVCAAMWELIREKTNLTDNDLVTKVAEIDARDGNADGKMTETPQKCPSCNRTLFPKHQRCLYCGAPRPIDSIFKTI